MFTITFAGTLAVITTASRSEMFAAYLGMRRIRLCLWCLSAVILLLVVLRRIVW